MKTPVPQAHVAIHDRVEALLAELPHGPLLDVPSGEGALAQRLIDLGFPVSCCDLYPQIFQLAGVENTKGDLDGTLPFGDQSFDYVVCVEGLEHICNPSNAIVEFARLLRPGGSLFVSIPNILNIEERIKFLFHGYSSHFKPISHETLLNLPDSYRDMNEIVLHVNPISYCEIRYLLESNGFEIRSLHIDKKKGNLRFYFPVVLAIRLLARFQSSSTRRKRWTTELTSDEVLCGGNTLILWAEKT